MTNFLMMDTFFYDDHFFDDDEINSFTRDMICYAAADVLALVKYHHDHDDVGRKCNDDADNDSNEICVTRLS